MIFTPVRSCVVCVHTPHTPTHIHLHTTSPETHALWRKANILISTHSRARIQALLYSLVTRCDYQFKCTRARRARRALLRQRTLSPGHILDSHTKCANEPIEKRKKKTEEITGKWIKRDCGVVVVFCVCLGRRCFVCAVIVSDGKWQHKKKQHIHKAQQHNLSIMTIGWMENCKLVYTRHTETCGAAWYLNNPKLNNIKSVSCVPSWEYLNLYMVTFLLFVV